MSRTHRPHRLLDAPSREDLDLLARDCGYKIDIDGQGFHVTNTVTGAYDYFQTVADAIEIICRRAL